MPELFATVLFYSSVAALATAGGAASFLGRKWSRKELLLMVSFAAGVLISAAFLHMIPEALGLASEKAVLLLLAGFSAMYVLEKTVMMHACSEFGEKCDAHAAGLTAVLGMGLHSLVDGVAIGAGFNVSPVIGIAATVGVVIHEFPEGMATMSVMLASGYKRRTAFISSLVVAAATPLGALLSLALLGGLGAHAIGMALAFAAGTFVYIAGSDLIPQTHEQKGAGTILAFAAGVFLLYAATGLV